MTEAVETKHVDELRLLEAEAVHIIREVVAELERPVLLFSAGKTRSCYFAWQFSPGDRTENIRRVGHLTRLLADAGVVALASLVSPLRSDRETPRALNDAAKLPFIEVHVATSLAECEKRDPKGLYKRARSGELKGLTGIDAPYEPPEDADLVLDTAGVDTEDLAAQVIALLDERSPRPQSR